MVMYPVHPKIAIVLIHKKDEKLCYTNDGIYFANTSDEGVISHFNKKALEYEQFFNNNGEFIVGFEKDLINLQI